MKKIITHYLYLNIKNNELRVQFLFAFITNFFVSILIGANYGQLAFITYIAIASLLIIPPYFLATRVRICPSCRSWEYKRISSIEYEEKQDFKSRQCQRCKSISQQK